MSLKEIRTKKKISKWPFVHRSRKGKEMAALSKRRNCLQQGSYSLTELSFNSCTPFFRMVLPPPSVHKCKIGNAELTATHFTEVMEGLIHCEDTTKAWATWSDLPASSRTGCTQRDAKLNEILWWRDEKNHRHSIIWKICSNRCEKIIPSN